MYESSFKDDKVVDQRNPSILPATTPSDSTDTKKDVEIQKASDTSSTSTPISVHSSVLVVLLTSCWYFTSSKNAIATQQLVETGELYNNDFEDNNTSKINPSTMVLLTSLQILAGLGVSIPMYIIISKLKSGQSSDSSGIYQRLPFDANDNPTSSKTGQSAQFLNPKTVAMGLVGILHYTGSFFTNMGFMYGSATLVQVVKLLEPVETLIFMALVNVCCFRKGHGVTAQKFIGTFFVVGGASIILLQKEIKAGESKAAVGFALLSGLTLATRNVTQKSVKASDGSKEKMNKISSWQSTLSKGLENFITINLLAAIPSIVALTFVPKSHTIVSSIFHATQGCGIQAVFFHGLYNMASISVLSMVVVQTHSLLNVGKRIINVIVATIYFDIQLQISGFIGLLVALFGGLVYSGAFNNIAGNIVEKSRKGSLCKVVGKRDLFYVFLLCGVLGPLFYNTPNEVALGVPLVESKEKHMVLPKFNFSAQEGTDTKRHIILLGPHERFNFGDLLFEKVLSKLLMTQLGYEDHEIVRAATIPKDMTVHGGYNNIVSMKQAQNMSRTSPYGPFDIIYTGGETSTCLVDECASKMLGSPELEALGQEANKTYECAYLFPKKMLLPLNDNDEPDVSVKNVAIANSIGGYPGLPVCNTAVETADYKVFRDADPLVPDCAVMVKELYRDEVSSALKEVRSELFPEDENRKYIAVQFRSRFEPSFNVKLLPEELDRVARETNCTIVLFAAGTAPYHDSFEVYRNVASQMKEPVIVYEADHVWKTVATIAGAEAVFSTSLHVRIMAFIFLKPRVTWCTLNGGKHASFIHLWEAPDMRVCGAVSTTWTTMSQYWGETPAITQNKTEVYYKEAVHQYMTSFGKWGTLLDDSNKISKVSQ